MSETRQTMADPPALPEATLDRQELQRQLNETVRDSLPMAVLILTGMYALFALKNLFLLPPTVAVHLALVAGGTAIVLALLSLWLFRRPLTGDLAQPVMVGVILLILTEVLYHLSIQPEARQVAGVAMLMVGAGCFLLSWRWLAVVLGLALSGCILVLLSINGTTGPQSAYLLSNGVMLGTLVHWIRLRSSTPLMQATAREQMLRKQVEHSERRSRRLFDSGLMGVLVADLNGQVVEANDRFLQILGYDRADMPRRWDDLTPPEWRDLDLQKVELLQTTLIAVPWEKEYFHKDGHRVPILLGAARLDWNSSECVCFVLDLTETRRAEDRVRRLTVELEHATRMATIGELYTGLAHDMRQPLAASVNLIRALRNKVERGQLENAELLQVLDRLESLTQRTSAMLRNTRESPNRGQSGLRPCSLRTCVETAVDLTVSGLRLPASPILVDLPLDLPPVLADGVQLTQALFSLLMNSVQAVHHHPPDEQLVVVSGEIQGDSQVHVEIRDNGEGIPQENLSQIFHQFFTTRQGASGLGLSIARTVIEQHKSSLKVNSTPGEGCTFYFDLTLAPDGSPAQSWTAGSQV